MTQLLAQKLQLPGGTEVTLPVGGNSAIASPTIGGIITPALEAVFLIASVLMFVWMVWGIFQYIFAGGEKEKLAKARSRITWAIVGFIIVLLAFTLSRYIQEIFPARSVPITPITEPTND
ncbi:MAG: pilin [Microgenomates group bacterium]|jgi:hypothetical protein